MCILYIPIWLPHQAYDFRESELGLVGLGSVGYDWVR